MTEATHKQTKPETIMTFSDESAAESYCRRRNAHRKGNVLVIVDGPRENEWTVMPCRMAVENGSVYRWVA